jgi:hypothetical protein
MFLGGGYLILPLLLSLLLIAKRRRRLLGIVDLALGFAAISCSKNDQAIDGGSSTQLYIRITQIDKDGVKTYSRVVKAVNRP